MSKRHQYSVDFLSRITRIQELIMSHSGIDEFYEVVRLILAKYFTELEGVDRSLPTLSKANQILRRHAGEISFILDGQTDLTIPESIYPEIQAILGGVNVHGLDFSPLDQVFEHLTSRTYKADKGQFFTPRHVVDMCIEAIDPKPTDIICDPACGSAAFLKSAHSYSTIRYGKTPKLYGFDYSHRACQIAKLVSLIGAAGAISVEQIDSLQLPGRNLLFNNQRTIEDCMGPKFKGFDIIFTNPPFAGDVSGESFARDYDITALFGRRVERDVLFLERCIRLLKVGGRLAIVLPDNKVSSRLFGDLRQWLGKQSQVKAVISLHRYTFLPYTSQKAAVIVAVKQAPALSVYNSKITFFRSDKGGKTSNGSSVYKPGTDPNRPAYESLDHDLQEIASGIKETLCAI